MYLPYIQETMLLEQDMGISPNTNIRDISFLILSERQLSRILVSYTFSSLTSYSVTSYHV